MLDLHFKISDARPIFLALFSSPSKLSSSPSKLLLLHRALDHDSLPPYLGTFCQSFFSLTCSIEYLGLFGELVLTSRTFFVSAARIWFVELVFIARSVWGVTLQSFWVAHRVSF